MCFHRLVNSSGDILSLRGRGLEITLFLNSLSDNRYGGDWKGIEFTCSLRIGSLNVCGFRVAGKMEETERMLENRNLDVITLSQTILREKGDHYVWG